MRITELQVMNMEMTDALRTYATEKVMSLEKFAKRFVPCDVAIEIGKNSEHHQKGMVFFAEMNVIIPGDVLRAHNESDDLYAAIDDAKDDIKRQLIDKKEKIVDARTGKVDDSLEEIFVDDSEE